MKKIVILAALLAFFGLGTNAFAETWMGYQWDYDHDGNSSFDWTDDTLDYINTAGGNGFAAGISQNELDFSGNFWHAAKYHFADTVNNNIDLGLGFGISPEETIISSIHMNSGTREYVINDTISHDAVTVTDYSGGAAIASDGWIGLQYEASVDKLSFGLYDAAGTTFLKGGVISNFINEYNEEDMSFVLTGHSSGNGVTMGQANFYDYSVSPEPVSSLLFLAGGAMLAVRRYKGRKKAH